MYSLHDYYSAIKVLICPQSGRLEELHIGDFGSGVYDDKLAGLVSGLSSLKTLALSCASLSPHVPYLMRNTCLTTLVLKVVTILLTANYSTIADIPHVATILKHNKTLQHLKFEEVSLHHINSLRTLIGIVSSSNTLKSIRIGIAGAGDSDVEILDYMRTHHRDLTSDHRITWVRRS